MFVDFNDRNRISLGFFIVVVVVVGVVGGWWVNQKKVLGVLGFKIVLNRTLCHFYLIRLQ